MRGFSESWRATGAAAVLLAAIGAWTHAVAETAPTVPVDVCQNIDDTLIQIGKQIAANAKKEEPKDDAAIQLALSQIAAKPPTMTVKIEGDTLAGPGVASVAIEDKRIEALTDLSKVCVKAYRKPKDTWEPATIRQIVLADKTEKTPKRLQVAFDIRAPEGAWADVEYLIVAALSDVKPAQLLNYSKTLTVRSRWWAFGWSLALVIAAYAAIAWATFDWAGAGTQKKIDLALYFLHPVRISSASYGEASMSQLQVLLFTLIVGGLLFHLWFTTLALSDISTDLLKLLGISAIGAVGARFTHTLKTAPNDQTARYLIGKGWYNWTKVDMRELATFRQLLLTDGRLDVYKFQIAIFTIVVACYVLSSGQSSLGDVKISETMLYLIGISQGVYVGGKAVTDRTTDLEAAVQKMIDLEPQIHAKEVAPATATSAAELEALKDEYKKAALVAVQEFASLQHRLFPTTLDAAKREDARLARQIRLQEAQLAPGAARPPALVDLDTQRAAAAQKVADLTPQFQDTKVAQEIRNIDPDVLRP
jgi:hypothetical protein